MNTIGEVIHAEMVKKKVGCHEVAEAIGLSKMGVYQLIRYRQACAISTVDKIAEYFSLDKKWLAEINFKASKPYREYERYINSL